MSSAEKGGVLPRVSETLNVHLPVSYALDWWRTLFQPGTEAPSKDAAVNMFVRVLRADPKFTNFFVQIVKTGIFEDFGGRRSQKMGLTDKVGNLVFYDDDNGRIIYHPVRGFVDRNTGLPARSVQLYKFRRLGEVPAAGLTRAFVEGKGFGSSFGADAMSWFRARKARGR